VTSVPPILAATAGPAMIRFHGHGSPAAPGYAYREDELIDWAGQLRGLAQDVEQVHALMNNCCGDQAQRDAARLAALLDGH
jgi:uncharacterized protein YecE (DUF72 family)